MKTQNAKHKTHNKEKFTFFIIFINIFYYIFNKYNIYQAFKIDNAPRYIMIETF